MLHIDVETCLIVSALQLPERNAALFVPYVVPSSRLLRWTAWIHSLRVWAAVRSLKNKSPPPTPRHNPYHAIQRDRSPGSRVCALAERSSERFGGLVSGCAFTDMIMVGIRLAPALDDEFLHDASKKKLLLLVLLTCRIAFRL